MKTALLILFSLLCINAGYAEISISGKVTLPNGSPVAGATVILKGSYDGAVTNNDGQYSFNTSLEGEQILRVRFIGLIPQEIVFSLLDSNMVMNVTLKENLNELNTVQITAGSFEAGDKKKSVALSSIDMITVPGAQGNVVGAMQYLPGTTTNGESGKLFVRGGSSRESQIYIDGTLVPVAFNPSAPNTAVRSKFNPFLFDGTVFSTGGFSAEYGQALSSVLLLDTKGIQEQDQLDISILSVGLGLAGTKKWKNGAITASFDHTNLAPYLKLIPQNLDWIKTPRSNNAGLNFRQKTKKGLLKVFGTYNDSYFELRRPDLDNAGVLTQYDLTNKNYFANTSWTGKAGKNWILKLAGAFTHDLNQVFIEEDQYTETLNAAHLKAVGTRKLGNRVKLKIGAESLLNHYAQNFETDEQSFPFDYNDAVLGSFAEFNFFISKKWVARVGGRYEYSSHLEKSNLSPRLSMAYKVGEHGQFSAATGAFYQQANPDYLVYTNQLDFERANQYMLNYQWSKNKRTFRGEVYLKEYQNLTKFTDEPFFLPEHYTNNGSGYARGFDLFFRDKKTIKNGDYWVSYSFLDTERDELNYTNAAVPGFASKHNLSIVYKHWIRKWRSLIGGSFAYSSPRFYNDPNEETFNNQKMKAYHSLNLNWTYLYRENIIFYAAATNVLGYQQEFGYEFSNTPNADGIYEKRLIQPPAPRFFVLGCFITLSKSGNKNQLDKIR